MQVWLVEKSGCSTYLDGSPQAGEEVVGRQT